MVKCSIKLRPLVQHQTPSLSAASNSVPSDHLVYLVLRFTSFSLIQRYTAVQDAQICPDIVDISVSSVSWHLVLCSFRELLFIISRTVKTHLTATTDT